MLSETQQAIQQAAERVGPSVVGVGRSWGRGSGVVIAEGRVLTNAHVLRGEQAGVTFSDGRVEVGRLVGSDADLDLAVIATDTGDAPAIQWDPAAVSEIGLGTPVLAVANPGGGGIRVTVGYVSATGRSFRGPRGRRVAGSIEHTAPAPRGSSGSPLVDRDGRLLGINTLRLDGGFILALPADEALQHRFDALSRGEAPSRPRLGVALAPPRAARRMRSAVGLPERDGLLIRAVEEDGPAARAGLERGDLLVALDGAPLTSLDELFDALEARGSLRLRVVRGAEEREVEIPLA